MLAETQHLRIMDALIRYIYAKSKIVEHPSNLKLNFASHIRAEGSSHEPICVREDPSSFLGTSISTIQSALRFGARGGRGDNERK